MTGTGKTRRGRKKTRSTETPDESTRDVILRTAIRHFATHGYDGTRIRQVLLDAGVNLALAHYHFGSKQTLYDAAVRQYLDDVLRERQQGLLAWQARRAPSTLERVTSLFACYVRPHMRIASGPEGQAYARLIQGVWSNPGPHTREILRETLVVRAGYLAELRGLVRHVSDELLYSTMRALVAAMLAESIDHADSPAPKEPVARSDVAEQRAMFVARLIAGGLLAFGKARVTARPR